MRCDSLCSRRSFSKILVKNVSKHFCEEINQIHNGVIEDCKGVPKINFEYIVYKNFLKSEFLVLYQLVSY